MPPVRVLVGDGFDPSSVHSPDDEEEALERSEAWVFFVPLGGLPALRQAMAGALDEHAMPTAWVIPSGNDADIVVRAQDHVREPYGDEVDPDAPA